MLYFGEVLAMRGTPQAIVADFVNAGRQHMLQKTPDKLLCPDGHGFRLSIPGILIPKGNLAVAGRDYSAVGDGDTMNVTGEIIEDCASALDGWLAVNDPFLLPYRFRQVNILKVPANTVKEAAAEQS